MEFLDLYGTQEFSAAHHVQKTLAASSRCDVSIACWEPRQTSPIHSHPAADEIYHVLEGEALFRDGRAERRLGPGGTVLFLSGEVHQVESLTRLVLYRVQAGADRGPVFFANWPES
jgi:quercetin dioxygenase-like cupin family protein